ARLDAAVRRRLEVERARLGAGAGRLLTLSPLQVLARGFSLTTTADDQVLRDAAAVEPGDLVHTRLERGALEAVVVRIHP
ncbi:MAG: exodeoxyribonuclease VII large subunit, partial [Planctomycetes bacterium]|nr:exodeoxyribonuclease VII large subunit [Planctomycetota bacterium]